MSRPSHTALAGEPVPEKRATTLPDGLLTAIVQSSLPDSAACSVSVSRTPSPLGLKAAGVAAGE